MGVPSHSKIPRNEKKADADAKKLHAKAGERETDQWSSLTHTKAELQKAKSAEVLI